MMPDAQSQVKEYVDPIKKDYMPYSCNVLTKDLIEYAAMYLNETEETKEKALKELKEHILSSDIGWMCKLNDLFLLCFLRSRKFDIKRTIALVDKGVQFFESNQNIFDRVDSDTVRRSIEANVVGFLPYRDSKGRALLLLRSEAWDPNQIKAEDIIFGSLVSLHSAAENPVNQVAGFVVIVDFKNLKFQQVVAMSSWLIFGLNALQRCCPCLVKEFHVLHTHALVRTTWKVVRPLISEKIRKRIMFYKSTHWNTLHQRIPPAILPEELGGQLGPFSNQHWAGDIASIENKYYQKVRLFMDRRKSEA